MKNVIDEGISNTLKYNIKSNLTKRNIENAIEQVILKIDKNINEFTHKFPSAASVDNIYQPVDNYCWTASFWTGMLWLAYEITGDERYRSVAEIHLECFKNRLDKRIETDNHDLGFLYTLSCVAAYRLTKNEIAKQTAIEAANLLISRFKPKGNFIQAWGDLNDSSNYRMIIDCLMNLPLLYWATEISGDNKYADIANKHFSTSMEFLVRDDASTFHAFFFNPSDGMPVKGVTAQGFSDNSCWARGQAWAVYGLPLNYSYSKDIQILGNAKKIINYFLNRLPEDYIPYWDLIFTEGTQFRDTSSASIAICGLNEIVKWLPNSDPLKTQYINASEHMLESLINNYTTIQNEKSNGLLLHGVYSIPHNYGIDECTIWGDYFYFEALVRNSKDWNLYW